MFWANAWGQERPETGRIAGRVTLADGTPVRGATVTLEGTDLRVITDTAGRFHVTGVPAGPHVLLVRRIGYAPARIAITLPAGGLVTVNVTLARNWLNMPEIVVTADATGRARGELGTATVIERDAIEHQPATSLQGILELAPGVPLQPPGLATVQQIPLRSVPTSTPASLVAGGPSAAELAAFGTLIVLDGVPLSNNANLQTTGPRGELGSFLPTGGTGGVDLRRIPASTIERVEVIRGVPSARYGDFTQGVIVVDTRAASVEPATGGRVDPRTIEGNAIYGSAVGVAQWLTTSLDVARTQLQPGLTADAATRVAARVAHGLRIGRSDGPVESAPLALDTRLDLVSLIADNPERPAVFPGRASFGRDLGLRLSERLRVALRGGNSATATLSVSYTQQRSRVQALRLRGALPFTDRVTEGTSVGRFVEGQYLSQLRIEGDAWFLYGRLEGDFHAHVLGVDHRFVTGGELRREWNAGAGLMFDIERPPQVTFNGVQGFDRPRRFDVIPPVATSTLYADDRLLLSVLGMTLDAQVGLRLDLLHSGTHWFSDVRHAVLQPRVNLQLSPWSWIRLRGGFGRTAKTPAVGSLYPARQYYDVVNVNWFANDPAERLAVLTTFIRDPTNFGLGFAVARKQEAGLEIGTGSRGLALSVLVFNDRTSGAVGFRSVPGFLVRDLHDFADSTSGTGRPPPLIEPSTRADTVPILLGRPDNVLTLGSRGLEATLAIPEIRLLRVRLHVQAAWVRTEFRDGGLDFGRAFSDFQINGSQPRAPYWEGINRTSARALITYRPVYHRPDLGFVVTAVVQHIAKEVTEDIAGVDPLSFAGYITRTGELVPVPRAERGNPEFADLQVARSGVTTARQSTPADWFLSLQVSKSLPFGGRLGFYAFNLLDRQGRITGALSARVFPRLQFGLEVMMPLGAVFGLSEPRP